MWQQDSRDVLIKNTEEVRKMEINLFDYGIGFGLLGVLITLIVTMGKSYFKFIEKQTNTFIEQISSRDLLIEDKYKDLIDITSSFKTSIMEIHNKQLENNFIFINELKNMNNRIENIEKKINDEYSSNNKNKNKKNIQDKDDE